MSVVASDQSHARLRRRGAPRQRRRRRTVAAVVMVAVAVGAAVRPTAPTGGDRAVSSTKTGPTARIDRPRPGAAGPPRAATRRLEPSEARVDGALPAPPRQERTHRLARRLARTFLRAFLRYETGRRPAGVLAGLRAGATPRLAELLITAPPRVPRAGTRPRVAAVERLALYGPWRGRLKAIAHLRRGRHRDVLELELRPGRRGWRVAALR